MATFRTTLLFLVLVLVLVTRLYFAVAPRAASAPQAPSWLSIQGLKDMLDARYEDCVGLPR